MNLKKKKNMKDCYYLFWPLPFSLRKKFHQVYLTLLCLDYTTLLAYKIFFVFSGLSHVFVTLIHHITFSPACKVMLTYLNIRFLFSFQISQLSCFFPLQSPYCLDRMWDKFCLTISFFDSNEIQTKRTPQFGPGVKYNIYFGLFYL